MEETILVETEISQIKWSSFLIRGIIAIIFGLVVLTFTELTLEIIVMLFGIFLIINAIMSFVIAGRAPAGSFDSTIPLFAGILGIIVGLVAILSPFFIAMLLVEIIALLAFVIGFSDIAMAIFNENYPSNRILLGLSGALSVILGGIFIFYPLMGGIVLVAVYLGIFAIVIGIISIILAFMIKGQQNKPATD